MLYMPNRLVCRHDARRDSVHSLRGRKILGYVWHYVFGVHCLRQGLLSRFNGSDFLHNLPRWDLP